MSAEVDLINDMGTWKYCKIRSGEVAVTYYSDGRLEIPDTHYREIEDVVACLLYALKHGERLWSPAGV